MACRNSTEHETDSKFKDVMQMYFGNPNPISGEEGGYRFVMGGHECPSCWCDYCDYCWYVEDKGDSFKCGDCGHTILNQTTYAQQADYKMAAAEEDALGI